VPQGPGPLPRRGAWLSEKRKKKKENRPIQYAAAGPDGIPSKSMRLQDLEAEVRRQVLARCMALAGLERAA